MRTSIIIPNYNTDWLLEKNLPVILKAAVNKKNNILEIILVDDGSEDKSSYVVRKNFPQVKLIRHTKNRGFSASVNTGARAAKGDLLVLLNTDVLPAADFLERIIPLFTDPKVFAVSLNEGGYSWAKAVFENGFIGHTPGPKDNRLHETFWVSGGSGVFRSSIWKKLGGLDEALLSPFYWEDLDIAYRAHKRGYKLYWSPDGRVEHKHETTMKRLPQGYVQKIRERNHLLLIWKNLTSPNLFRKHIRGLTQRILKNPGYLKVVLMALLKFNIVSKARKKEKKESKISDEQVFAKFSK